MKFKMLALAATAALATATPAAAVVTATFAASIVGVTASMGHIGLGTTFTNSLFSIIGSGTGDLANSAGTFLTLAPVTATVGSAVSFTSNIGNFAGTVNRADSESETNNSTVSAFVLGTFTPLGSIASLGDTPASLTFSFTQTGGAGSAVSGSFSFAAPPAVIPEPATWGMLIGGFGLTGAAMRRRRTVVAA